MFQRFMNPTVIYMRRIQHGLEEARMAALEHESAAEHHAALATMYRDRVRRLQAEMEAVTNETEAAKSGNDPSAEAAAAAQVHRITPRSAKREDGTPLTGANSGYLPQGAAG